MNQTQPSPVDSMREAVFTVSPNRQYLGIACPTTPVLHNTPDSAYTAISSLSPPSEQNEWRRYWFRSLWLLSDRAIGPINHTTGPKNVKAIQASNLTCMFPALQRSRYDHLKFLEKGA